MSTLTKHQKKVARINRFAEREGWAIFNDYEIQADADSLEFDNDDEALNHVRLLAAEGSALHREALELTGWSGVIAEPSMDIEANVGSTVLLGDGNLADLYSWVWWKRPGRGPIRALVGSAMHWDNMHSHPESYSFDRPKWDDKRKIYLD